MGDTVESIFILDDIVGFINEEHYKEFAHPYLKRICDAFPEDWVKVYHNDAEVDACLDHLPDCGFNVLNWGKQKDIREVKQRVGDRMCLMGNVNPLEIAVRGTPEEVREATLDVLEGGGGRGNDPLRRRRHQPRHAAGEHRRDARCARRIQFETTHVCLKRFALDAESGCSPEAVGHPAKRNSFDSCLLIPDS